MNTLASRISWLHLLLALSIALALLLGGLLLYLLLIAPTSNHPGSISSSKHIATAQTATAVDPQGRPTDATDTFALGQTVYIAYLVNDAGPGTVRIKLYNNGHLIDTQTQAFARRSTYNAYFVFPATQEGRWEADLYWLQPGTTGDGTLEQKVTFLVGSTSLHFPCPVSAAPETALPWQPPSAHDMMDSRPFFRPPARLTTNTAAAPQWVHKEAAHATHL